MRYAGFIIRQERLNRNWSQEGLCRGICTVSYLSKIELGKTEPSEEILCMLMRAMGLAWHGTDAGKDAVVQRAYDILLGAEEGLAEFLSEQDADLFVYSPYGPDWALLTRFAGQDMAPLDEELEACLDSRQLALQRLLQGRGQEAVSLYPAGFVQYMAGVAHYHAGRFAPALEMLQAAFQLAAQEGRARLMLHCKAMMGNCYANQNDLPAMEQHYIVASRLSKTLGDEQMDQTLAYNRAATQLEMGRYEQALGYFQSLKNPSRMELHKLAICLEKLGRRDEAAAALEKAETAQPSDAGFAELEKQLLEIVSMRIGDRDYLSNADYGEKLLRGFDACRRRLPAGYAQFHLPWVLEWYEHNRQ